MELVPESSPFAWPPSSTSLILSSVTQYNRSVESVVPKPVKTTTSTSYAWKVLVKLNIRTYATVHVAC